MTARHDGAGGCKHVRHVLDHRAPTRCARDVLSRCRIRAAGTVYHSRLSLSLARSRVITRRLALAHTRRVARLRSHVAVPQVSLLARSVTRAAACARGAGVRSRCRSRAPDISPGSGERSVASRCRLHLRTWSTPSTHHSQHSLFPFSPRTSSTLSTQHSHHYPYLVGPLAHTVHSLKIM